MKFQRFSFFFVIALLVTLSCSKNEDIPGRIDPGPFKVNSISKDRGMGGDILEIYGSGFGVDRKDPLQIFSMLNNR